VAGDISPENEQFIQRELASGIYHSRGALLDDAVGLLKRRRDLQREIQAGMDSGAGIPASEVFARLEENARQLATGGPL
jgi:Arc/MetJ-type ribon-helix-helix transcriptional regulator